MDAGFSFVDENRHRRLRSGIGDMLSHFFHNEWITNQKAHDFGGIAPRLLTNNGTVIECHKHHQSCSAETALNRSFQLIEGLPTVYCIKEFGDFRMPNRRFDRCDDGLEGFRRRHAQPFKLYCSACHISFLELRNKSAAFVPAPTSAFIFAAPSV